MTTLEKLYANHDWHYDKSDDYSVWTRGNAQWQAICHEESKLMSEGVTLEEVQALRAAGGDESNQRRLT